LEDNGKAELAKKARHVSREDGDGAGYDILSFDLSGNEKYIEVKTTSDDINTPFIVTKNELKFSEIYSDNFYIYIVYNFNKTNITGNFYELKGYMNNILNLEAIQFLVTGIKNN